MILDRLICVNFRCFYGTQEITFSKDKKRNVTLIHAENGFGKTTLLNALIWVLYGRFSKDVEKKDEVINSRALAEQTSLVPAHAKVTLDFEHENKTYSVTREKYSGAQSTHLVLHITDTEGSTAKSNNPQEVIKSILPDTMYNYFFFNGERIDYLASEEAKSEVSKAIQSILGMELLDQSIKQVDKAKKTFNKTLSQYGSAEGKRLSEIQEKLMNEEETIQANIANIEKNIKSNQKTIFAIQKTLNENQHTRDNQRKREELESKLHDVKQQLNKLKRQSRSNISKNGYKFFLSSLIKDAKHILDEKKATRQLPALYKEDFIQDILEEKKCICGNHFDEGSAEFNNINSMLASSGNESTEQHYIECKACISNHNNGFDSQQELFNDFRKKIADNEYKRKELNDQISEVSNFLAGHPLEDIQKLENERMSLDRNIGSDQYKIESHKKRLTDITKEQISNNREIEKSQNYEIKAIEAQRTLALTENINSFLKKYKETKIKSIRQELSSNISSAFDLMCNKDYHVNLTDNFYLQVLGNDNKPVAKSTGENQITSLSFIGGLVKLAQIDKNKKSAFRVGGGDYPIVMDSPFGSLDNDYRAGISQWIPTVAKQVVIFVSSSQYVNQVEKALSKVIGKEYYLQFHSTSIRDKTPREITINKKKYTQFIDSPKYSYTEIKVMEN